MKLHYSTHLNLDKLGKHNRHGRGQQLCALQHLRKGLKNWAIFNCSCRRDIQCFVSAFGLLWCGDAGTLRIACMFASLSFWLFAVFCLHTCGMWLHFVDQTHGTGCMSSLVQSLSNAQAFVVNYQNWNKWSVLWEEQAWSTSSKFLTLWPHKTVLSPISSFLSHWLERLHYKTIRLIKQTLFFH